MLPLLERYDLLFVLVARSGGHDALRRLGRLAETVRLGLGLLGNRSTLGRPTLALQFQQLAVIDYISVVLLGRFFFANNSFTAADRVLNYRQHLHVLSVVELGSSLESDIRVELLVLLFVQDAVERPRNHVLVLLSRHSLQENLRLVVLLLHGADDAVQQEAVQVVLVDGYAFFEAFFASGLFLDQQIENGVVVPEAEIVLLTCDTLFGKEKVRPSLSQSLLRVNPAPGGSLVYLLVIVGSQVEVSVHLSLERKVLHLLGVIESVLGRWHFLEIHHLVEGLVQLVDQENVELGKELLHLDLVSEGRRSQELFTNNLDHAVLELFFEGKILSTRVEFVEKLSAP